MFRTFYWGEKQNNDSNQLLVPKEIHCCPRTMLILTYSIMHLRYEGLYCLLKAFSVISDLALIFVLIYLIFF